MKVLLDTNIIIHREASTVVNQDIGILFKWLDDLKWQKCIHPVTKEEINKHKDPKIVATFNIKLDNYYLLKTIAPIHQDIQRVCIPIDKNENDSNDTLLLNEVINNRVDILISEDNGILNKASLLGICDCVFTIDSFLEKVTAENPKLKDYKVLSVKQELFGNLNLYDEFFNTLKEGYADFEKWFNKKADEIAYVCRQDEKILVFLYIKIENENENYSDISPVFTKKRRLKIGTFKVDYNGFKLGERFLKIIFDNALLAKVEEIYVTIYNKDIEQKKLINMLEEYGFILHGYKGVSKELVYVRNFSKKSVLDLPKKTFPYISTKGNIYIVPIYSKYHTNLFPDSILKTESPTDYIENEPFRNAISKIYISRSIERNLKSGDIVIFYLTGGDRYKSIITTIGIIESMHDKINSENDFIRFCGKRSVFSIEELKECWNYNIRYRPFIVNFLYAYSFPKRINRDRLLHLNITALSNPPRGFTKVLLDDFIKIIKETKSDESIIVY